MNIFDVIGPVMIGPSSSHTAGARTFIVIGDQHSGGLAGKGADCFAWELCSNLPRPWYGYGAFGGTDGLAAG